MQSAAVKKSKLLSQIEGIQHGFFTRNGGVSKGVYASLNCSPGSNDDINNVMENRQRVMAVLGMESDELFGLNQIHSTRVFTITPEMPNEIFRSGDAMVTQHKGLALSVLGADCAPILFAASNAPVVAAAHAGWKGAVTGIVAAVVDEMCRLGAEKQAITACIGPTIHQTSYEVREDFILQLNNLSSFDTDEFLLENGTRYFFDLPHYLEKQCQLSGIGLIENIGLNTYELEDEFFSFRRNTHAGEKEYGRQISVIALR